MKYASDAKHVVSLAFISFMLKKNHPTHIFVVQSPECQTVYWRHVQAGTVGCRLLSIYEFLRASSRYEWPLRKYKAYTYICVRVCVMILNICVYVSLCLSLWHLLSFKIT